MGEKRSQGGKIETHPRDPRDNQGSPPQTSPLLSTPAPSSQMPKGASHLHKGNAQGCAATTSTFFLSQAANLLHSPAGWQAHKTRPRQKFPTPPAYPPGSPPSVPFIPSPALPDSLPIPDAQFPRAPTFFTSTLIPLSPPETFPSFPKSPTISAPFLPRYGCPSQQNEPHSY